MLLLIGNRLADDPGLSASGELDAIVTTPPSQAGGGGGKGGHGSGGGGDAQPRPPEMQYDFGEHAVEQMIERGYNFRDICETLRKLSRTIVQSNGNTVFVGQNGVGVVVDQASGRIMTVLRPEMIAPG